MNNLKNPLKNNLLAVGATALLTAFAGCGGDLQPAFTGTYVNHAGSEASIASDTLTVVLEQDNTYSVYRSTGYRLLDENGKAGDLQHEKEAWKAVYDPRTQVMTERRNGKLITFDTGSGTMTVGRRKYKRIN